MNQFFALTPARRGLVAVLCLFGMSTAAVAQMARSMSGTCSKCNREVTWTEGTRAMMNGSSGPPKNCPFCNVRFDYVEDDKGMKKRNFNQNGTSFSGSSSSGSSNNFYILGALCLLVVVGLGIGGVFLVVKLASGTGKKRRRKPRSRPRHEVFDDDDSDLDDRPRRRTRR